MLPIINVKQHFSSDLITQLECEKTDYHFKQPKYDNDKLEIVSVIVLLILANRFCVFQIICQKTIHLIDNNKLIVSPIFIGNTFMFRIIIFKLHNISNFHDYLVWNIDN